MATAAKRVLEFGKTLKTCTLLCDMAEAERMRETFGVSWKDLSFAQLDGRTVAAAYTPKGIMCLLAIAHARGDESWSQSWVRRRRKKKKCGRCYVEGHHKNQCEK